MSTDLPAVAPYGEAISVASDREEFASLCRRAIDEPEPAGTREARRRLVAASSWEAKTHELVELCAARLDQAKS